MSICSTSHQQPLVVQNSTASITGVILAGGRSSRMGGTDKGLLALAGEPMINHSVRVLKPQVQHLVINANRNIDAYARLGHPVIPDSSGDFLGPLAGMLAAMDYISEHFASDYLITVPCDSPLLAADYVQRMSEALIQQRSQISVASDGNRLQPVFALINVSLRQDLAEYLEQKGRKIDRWFARHATVEVDFSDHQAMFRNINTPSELEILAKELA